MELKKRIYSSEIKKELGNFAGKDVIVAGWVEEIRDLGNLKFIILRDRNGFIQICIKKGKVPEDIIKGVKGITRESVLAIKGNVITNKIAPNGFEIYPQEIEILSLAETPLPLDPSEKSEKSFVKINLDTRLDNRFLDLRRRESSAIFKLRSKILQAGRKFFVDNGFIEINSPKIIASASEGGTELFPIAYFDKEAFLAQSPQLYKQMMMATGFDKVFETTFYFRAELHDTTRHLNEITAFDCEISFIDDENDVMNVAENLVKSILKSAKESEEIKILSQSDKTVIISDESINNQFPRITYDECLELLDEYKKIEWGEDIDSESEKILGKIVKEKFNSDLFFITKYPLKIKPFYTAPENFDDANSKYSRAFDLEYKGVEICSGGQRIHIYDLLVERIKANKLNPENFKSYLNAFRYGMPTHGGFGLGIDRILMQILDKNIREVVLFPRDRRRLTP